MAKEVVPQDQLLFDNQRIYMLFSRSFSNQYAGLITAVGYVWYVHKEIESPVWIGWLALFFLVFLFRRHIHGRYFAAYNVQPVLENPLEHERWLALGNMLAGVCWAVASYVMLPETKHEYLVLFSFILAGNTAGAAVGYSASVLSTGLFVFPSLVPLMVILWASPESFRFLMGWLLFLYLLVNSFLFKNLNKHIKETIALRFEKDKLVTELVDTQSKAIYSAKMAALGEMAGGIAHEINNPLAIIQMASDQIRQALTDQPVDMDFLERSLLRIEKTVERASQIVKSLRLFSKDESKASRFPMALEPLIQETIVLCGEKFRGSEITLNVPNIDANLKIVGNQVQLSQVLLNLLNNAYDVVKSIPDPKVEVVCEKVDNFVEIAVIDNGPGIPEKVQAKIFQPFFTTKDVGHGTGLGLSISHGIVTAHDGQLSFETQPGRTKFVIRLALAA